MSSASAAATALAPLRDFQVYAESLWTITPKDSLPRQWRFNAAQRITNYERRKQHKRGYGVRMKVLKYRQGGESTFFCGLCQQECSTRHGTNSISVADKLKLPGQWLTRGKTWHSQLRPELRPQLAKSNHIELYYDMLGSRYSIGSQLGQTPGMGETIHHAHFSELANWANLNKIFDDALPSVPKNSPDVGIYMESTGEMVGDPWHEQVMITLDGGDNFVLVFLPWFIHEEYRFPVDHPDLMDKYGDPVHPDNYTDEELEFILLANQWAKDHPDHAKIAGYKGISPQQMAFRRWVISEEFRGDIERFKSRYPACIDEAFMAVGSMGIPREVVMQHKATARDPKMKVRFRRRDDGTVEMVAYDGPDAHWHWLIYEDRKEICEYALGADVAEGKLSDPTDEKSDRDYSSATMLDRRTLATVAVFHGRLPADEWGKELLRAAIYYNMAYASPEANAAGMATLAAMKAYPNLMTRTGLPDEENEERDINRLGWKTTPTNRDKLIDDWIEACMPDQFGSYEGRILCWDEGLAGEEATFVYNKQGKREHRPRCKDDRLFGAMVALQVHKCCPHIRRTVVPEQESHEEEYKALGAVTPPPSHMFAGGIDHEAAEIMGLDTDEDDGL